MADEMIIAFDGEPQTESNWCWAATARCVSHTYDRASPFTQCTIAKAASGCESCNNCNQPFELEKPLTTTGNLLGSRAGHLTWAKVKAEINAGRIICVKIAWNQDGGHFVSIFGYSRVNGTNWLHVYDTYEDSGEIIMKHSEFKQNYFNIGKWFFTYLTDKNPGAGN